jgi:uncharacterized protein (DUF4415 family)
MRKRKRTAKRWVDPDDAPEFTQELFERADLYYGDRLIRPGKGGPNPHVAKAIRRTRGRPPSDNPKRQITLRIDADVIEHFSSAGPGWQTRINAALRRAAKLKPRA